MPGRFQGGYVTAGIVHAVQVPRGGETHGRAGEKDSDEPPVGDAQGVGRVQHQPGGDQCRETGDAGQARAQGEEPPPPGHRYQIAHQAAPLGRAQVGACEVDDGAADEQGYRVLGKQSGQQGQRQQRAGLQQGAIDDDGPAPAGTPAQPGRHELAE